MVATVHPSKADCRGDVNGNARGLSRFARIVGAPVAPTRDRLILTAHSGGGMPAVDTLSGAAHPPDELHFFDALYGRDPRAGDPLGGLDILDRWLGDRLAGEPGQPGALRVVYIEGETGRYSRAVGEAIARHLATADPALRPMLARRYRIERSFVPHSHVAMQAGPSLLAAAEADIAWWEGP